MKRKKRAEELRQAVAGPQTLGEEEQTLRDEIYSRLELWEQECREYHDRARLMREVMRRNDPDQDPQNTPANERTLQLHTLASTVNNSVSEQMERMPEAKLIPETAELQQVADVLQDVVHYVVYNVNEFEAIHKRRMEDYFVTGTSILQVAWDPDMSYGKGDIALIRWPVEAFLWDPQAENIQDARAIMKLSWHPMSWYRDHYPDAAPYVGSEEGQHNQIGLADAQRDLGTRDEDRALLVEYWYRTYENGKYKINVAYCAGGALLIHEEDVYAHGEYPFIVDVHSTIEGQPVGEGMVGEFRAMQQYINKYQRYIDTNLRFSSKGRMLINRNSGIDRQQLADWSRDTIEGNRIIQGEDWAWLSHQPLNGMNYTMIQQMQQALAQDAGVSSVMRGQLPSDYASGKAVVALQETGSKISNLRTAGLRSNFKHAVEQILWLMSQFYDRDRVVMIAGQDGLGMTTTVNARFLFGGKGRGGATPPPPYVVQIEINNRNPMRIDQQNEMYMQAYTMAAQAQQAFPLSALFSLLNIEGKDRVLPVIRENEMIQQQMAQMQQQMEQMGAQLQQAQAENQSLRQATQDMTNSLANIRAKTGGGISARPNDPRKIAEAGPAPESEDAAIMRGREASMAGNPMA